MFSGCNKKNPEEAKILSWEWNTCVNELMEKQMFLLQSNFIEVIKVDSHYFVEEIVNLEFQ